MNATAQAMELANDRPADGLLGLAERGLLPDALLRLGIRRLCTQRLRDEAAADPDAAARRNAALIDELRRRVAAAAQGQHRGGQQAARCGRRCGLDMDGGDGAVRQAGGGGAPGPHADCYIIRSALR